MADSPAHLQSRHRCFQIAIDALLPTFPCCTVGLRPGQQETVVHAAPEERRDSAYAKDQCQEERIPIFLRVPSSRYRRDLVDYGRSASQLPETIEALTE